MKRRINLEEDFTLATLLARLIPQFYQHVHTILSPLSLWVLLEKKTINRANDISASRLNNKSIITFPFAYTFKAVRYLASTLMQNGVALNNENIALCTFTLYIWVTKKIHDPLEKAFLFSQMHPNLFKQPYSFVQTFKQIIHDTIFVPSSNRSLLFNPKIKTQKKSHE